MSQDQRPRDAETHPLFPPVEPFQSGTLALDATHRMYYEQSGNPRGPAAVFLHGGPGAGASAVHRQFFDPGFWRIVVYDQRGAGRSTPLGSLVDNTTPHLLDDLERLREHLGIGKWLVFGGSWGSTLALAYAEHHRERCLALVLRGIFLCRESEIEWFLYGLKAIFPEPWRAFSGFIRAEDRGDLLEAYHKLLTNPDPAVHLPAARSWSVYEGSCSTLLPNPALVADFATDRVALGLARIRAIPAVIVQGRYDIVCPPISADDLHRAWPEADYEVISDAGHSAFEPGIRSRLVAATERMKERA